MSRPRQNSNELSAVDRMQNAFWSLLSENSYMKMTVTDIVDRACVNRNSFYYHYDRLSDLANSAIEHAVQSLRDAMPELVADPVESWRRIVIQLLGTPSNSIHMNHLAMVMSPNGAPELLRFIRDAIRKASIEVHHLDPNNLSLTSDLLLEFASGGLMALVSIWPRLSETVSLDELVTVDAAVLARTLDLSIADKNMPDYWTRFLQSTQQDGSGHPTTSHMPINNSDEDFRNQVQALLDKTNATRKLSEQDDSYTSDSRRDAKYFRGSYYSDGSEEKSAPTQLPYPNTRKHGREQYHVESDDAQIPHTLKHVK